MVFAKMIVLMVMVGWCLANPVLLPNAKSGSVSDSKRAETKAIVFPALVMTSPETFTMSLCPTIYVANQEGAAQDDAATEASIATFSSDFTTPYYTRPNYALVKVSDSRRLEKQQWAQHKKDHDMLMGCRSKPESMYVVDKDCTSVEPILHANCYGHCMPIYDMQWFAKTKKIWPESKLKYWQCVDDDVHYVRVLMNCAGGTSFKNYKVKIVTSCKCKRFRQVEEEILDAQASEKTNKDKDERKNCTKGKEEK